MRQHRTPVQWLFAGLAIAAGLSLVRCSSTSSESTTTAVSEALTTSGNSSDSVEVSGLMRGPDAFAPDSVEGFRCDPSPTVTYVTVCGKSLPATVSLSWTDCAAPEGRGPRGPGPNGEIRTPPDGGSKMGRGCPAPPEGACGSDGGTCMAGGPPAPGPSSGTVEITNTYTTPNGCDAAIEEAQTVTYDVSRTQSDGDVFSVKGTSTSTAELTPGAPPAKKSTAVDATRTVTDDSGAVLRSVHLTGTRTATLSIDTPPTRTVNESLNAAFADGTTGTVTLADVVYPPMSTCRWPTSGTLTHVSPDGTTHTLVYGPRCGAATQDGTVVQLKDGRGPGGRGGPEEGTPPRRGK